MNVKLNLYKKKDQNYFSNIRKEIYSLLPKNCHNVLDLGCGNGATLGWIKDLKVCNKTYGIDIVQPGPDTHKNIDQYLNKDLEECDYFFENTKFDLILILDVLEHLVDPDNFIKKVRNSLNDDGIIILCIPNIRHYSILKNIFIEGDFPYNETGILDKTHLRFFTNKSIKRFLNNQNLFIKETLKYPINFPSKSRILNLLTAGFFSEFFTQQYILKIQLNE